MACVRDRSGTCRVGGEGTRSEDPLGVPRRRCLEYGNAVFRKWDGEAWTGLLWVRIGTGGGLL